MGFLTRNEESIGWDKRRHQYAPKYIIYMEDVRSQTTRRRSGRLHRTVFLGMFGLRLSICYTETPSANLGAKVATTIEGLLVLGNTKINWWLTPIALEVSARAV